MSIYKLHTMVQKAVLVTIILLSTMLWGCATVPVSGRSQLLLISEEQEKALGVKAYKEILSKAKISQDPKVVSLVNRVGRRIAEVAGRRDYDWEFAVIDNDKTVNAFALPGGKVAVYTGILPYTKNEAGLAFVLGHEVGHAIARHGGERISQQLLVQVGQEGLNIAIAKKSPAAIQSINQAYGIATAVGVLLPFSRTQEKEADRIGLVLMARAGYNPREAIKFFERMMALKDKAKALPEFLSTHPVDETRIRQLREYIPEAMKFYKK